MKIMVREISWWYWLASAVLLTSGVAGWHWGYCLAGTLTMVQIVHFAWVKKSITAFPVQVRMGYLAILLAGIWEPMRWVYWVPLAGTWAMTLTGYCPLARVMSLLPWNRSTPVTLHAVWTTFIMAPQPGNVMQGLPEEQQNALGMACKLEFAPKSES